MIIFPAIDLRGGKCVRLFQGLPDQETVYSDNPAVMALRWEVAGARWLHVVNLDGSFAGSLHAGAEDDDLPTNLLVLRDIADAAHIPVQFGGGVRTMKDIEWVLKLGAARVILGTIAARNPAFVSSALARFGVDKIMVSIDARDGMVATHGWQSTSERGALSLAQEMAELGVQRVVYTDISRDGTLSGVNVEATAALAAQSGLKVIASGGVASLDCLHSLKQHQVDGVEGVIIGKALYTGTIQLEQAVAIAEGA